MLFVCPFNTNCNWTADAALSFGMVTACTVSSAQCFIALERVCLSKDQGGLGIKDLGLQNICLLLKLKSPILLQHGQPDFTNMEGGLCGEHWTVLHSNAAPLSGRNLWSLGN